MSGRRSLASATVLLLLTALGCEEPTGGGDPPDPVNLAAPVVTGSSTIELTWSESTADDFGNYRVYIGTGPGVDETSTLAGTVENQATPAAVLTGLEPFVEYYFVVYVADTEDLTAGSNEQSARTWFHYSPFDEDGEDWSADVGGGNLDSVEWVDHASVIDASGSMKLDGSDFGTSDHEPNAWLFRAFDLPAGIGTLTFHSSAHDRAGADSELRVRLLDESQNANVLLDWAVQTTGNQDEFFFVEMSADLSPFAGQSVTIFFEQGDNDDGNHEQRYIDEIIIR